MEAVETIRQKHRFDIFEQLQEDQTLVKMTLVGRSFEHLTLVTGTCFRKNTPCFLVDYPEGFREAAAGEKNCRIHFEFTGSDRVKYRFRTTGGEVEQRQVCIEFPEVIHRLQRRNDFRVAPPPGTRLCFQKSGRRYEMSVLNVSRRGALAVMKKEHLKTGKTPAPAAGTRLSDLVLVLPAGKTIADMQIKAAQVVRVDKNPLSGANTCAFHFDEMKADQEKQLIRLLYRFQRDLLQKKI